MTKAHFILYVADQSRSTAFYANVLGMPPTLDVPGMTEFTLHSGCILGLMPEIGIHRLLSLELPEPGATQAGARAELYLMVSDPGEYHRRAVAAGARSLSELSLRDWGHRVAYSIDFDGYILAFAAEA